MRDSFDTNYGLEKRRKRKFAREYLCPLKASLRLV
jgi:hypothetical protein